MTAVVDGDSHFMEPLDLYERYIDPVAARASGSYGSGSSHRA